MISMTSARTMILLSLAAVGAVMLSGCVGGGQPPAAGNQSTGQQGQSMIASPFGMLLGSDAQGQDLPCIGRPPGMVRGVYSTRDSGGAQSTTIVYYKQGLDFQNVQDYIDSKASECGWSKNSVTSASVSTPEFSIHQGSATVYEKGNETLTTSVIAASTKEGKQYTFANLVLEQGSGEQQAQENQQQEEETSGFESVPEQQVPEEAQAYDQMARPAIESAFGGAKLASYMLLDQSSGQPSMFLTYTVKNTLTSKNIGEFKQDLSAALVPEGYSNIISSMTSESFTFSYKDKKGSVITFSGDVGGDSVNMVVTPKT